MSNYETIKRNHDEYQNGMNEGGEGYNPYADQLKVATEQHNIDVARAKRNAALITMGFVDAATTITRRAEWNAMVSSGKFASTKGGQDMAKVNAQYKRQGWTIADLKNAMIMYGIN